MIINSLKSSQAEDIHVMDTSILKSLEDPLALPISKNINLSILQRVFPRAWQTAIMTPLYKAGDPQARSPTTGQISILPVVSKVAEKWIAE